MLARMPICESSSVFVKRSRTFFVLHVGCDTCVFMEKCYLSHEVGKAEEGILYKTRAVMVEGVTCFI